MQVRNAFASAEMFLFLIEINNMHSTKLILPIPRTCIWRRCGRCGRCGVS